MTPPRSRNLSVQETASARRLPHFRVTSRGGIIWFRVSPVPSSSRRSIESAPHLPRRGGHPGERQGVEAALDDLPLTWVTTPAREMGNSLAESMLRRLEEGTGETRNPIMHPRLVTRQ